MRLGGLVVGIAAMSLLAVAKKKEKKGEKKEALETMGEAETALPPEYPKFFPRGVLNPAWANDRDFLQKVRRALRRGRPVVIPSFLAPPVAEALLKHLKELAEHQRKSKEKEPDYPFKRAFAGQHKASTKKWKMRQPKPCARLVQDFLEKRDRQGASIGSFLDGGSQGQWESKRHFLFSLGGVMNQPAMTRFWRSLSGMPQWASSFDTRWSWMRQGNFESLHADDDQMRYLSVTVHLSEKWLSRDGGEFVWCGPDGEDDVLLESPKRPHFFKSFSVSQNGTALAPDLNNLGIIFPVFRNSYHAVGPVAPDAEGEHFSMQGWYVDPCHFQPPDSECVGEAMQRLEAWSGKLATAGKRTQPPLQLQPQPLPDHFFEL